MSSNKRTQMYLKNLLIAGMILLVAGCRNNPSGEYTTVMVKEVEQAGSYTYLLVKANGPEYWLAVPVMDARPGETYHYQGGMRMHDFHSQELDRTFEEILFLDALFAGEGSSVQGIQEVTPGSMVIIERSDVEVQRVEGTVSIAELYSDPAAYEGKRIRVAGEVTRFNPAIMERNWVHLQDGTEFEGKYDLTATSLESFTVGTAVTLEGILAIERDFGYGYRYEILLEEAVAVR
jgi:hypothetical protein